MQTDDSRGPASPRKLEAVTGRGYSVDSRINGRDVPCIARPLRPFAKIVFAWTAWRERRRTRRDSLCCKRAVTPRPVDMQYILKQNLVSLGNNFTIKDIDGRDAFLVRGALATLGDKLSFADMDGNELLYIEQKVFSWVGTYEIRREGRLVAEVRRNLGVFLRRRFTVEMADAEDLEMVGDILAFEYVVTRGDRKVATFTRQWLRLSDTYWIRIADDEPDAVLILALAVIVELVANHRHNY
jgi:uncharacterized protein YxjI